MTTILLVLFASLVISAVGLYSLFARDLSAAHARLIGHSKIIDTSFSKLEYALVGEGEPILIITAAAVA